jgi:hypothetical protein
MRNRRHCSKTRLCDLAIWASLVALLGLVPGCDFIDDLLGRGEEAPPPPDAAVVATADAAAPTPPPVVPAVAPDAAVAPPVAPPVDAGALAKLPPGFDISKLPPGFDPSKLPPGFDPSKLPPGVDPANLATGTTPPAGDAGAPSAVPDITADLPAGATPEKVDSSALPPAAALLPPEVQTQLGKALAVRKSLDAQIKRLNYVIDRNLTKDPADIVRLNRMVRAKRELDSRLRQMAKQYNVPPEALETQQ